MRRGFSVLLAVVLMLVVIRPALAQEEEPPFVVFGVVPAGAPYNNAELQQ